MKIVDSLAHLCHEESPLDPLPLAYLSYSAALKCELVKARTAVQRCAYNIFPLQFTQARGYALRAVESYANMRMRMQEELREARQKTISVSKVGVVVPVAPFARHTLIAQASSTMHAHALNLRLPLCSLAAAVCVCALNEVCLCNKT
jgi:hypothetical protein